MNLTIETTHNVLGRTDESPVGKKLFAVTWIDSDDCEDTKIELWIANDDDDLYRKSIEDSWGIEILYTEIGTIM